MPLPKTRRARWIFRRNRYLKRRRRWRRHYREKPFVPATETENEKHSLHLWLLKGTGAKMPPLAYYIKEPKHGILKPYDFVSNRYLIASGTNKLPAHVVMLSPLPGVNHFNEARIGWQLRAVKFRGHKLFRRTAAERMIQGAYRFYYENGPWPHWDPLLRVPFVHDDEFVPRSPYGATLDAQR